MARIDNIKNPKKFDKDYQPANRRGPSAFTRIKNLAKERGFERPTEQDWIDLNLYAASLSPLELHQIIEDNKVKVGTKDMVDVTSIFLGYAVAIQANMKKGDVSTLEKISDRAFGKSVQQEKKESKEAVEFIVKHHHPEMDKDLPD